MVFSHNGHTVVLTALARVQPCQTYHLKIVIADVSDHALDSGVFLEAKSLSSNSYTLQNLTQTDLQGNSYLVEGCLSGAVKIKRAVATPQAEVINLVYEGTAQNSVDVATMPASVTIPANATEVLLNIVPVVDNLPEGIELLKIYTVITCVTNVVKSDSTFIQLRDYDILQLTPGMAPDTAFICRNAAVQLTASTGYSTYSWDNNSTLSDLNSRTPIATPVSSLSKYYCTATLGTCNARDSLNIKWKDISLVSKININCANGNTGQIKVQAGQGNEWQAPLEFWLGNNPHQPDSTFNNLAAGLYQVKIKDASGCIDSIPVTLVQAFPDLTASLTSTDPTCLGGANGSITVTAAGGNSFYTYSIDGGPFQASNVFVTGTGLHTITVKDQNGCTKTVDRTLTFINTLTLAPGPDPTICEGKSTTITAVSNALSYEWTPAQTLSNANTNSPTASPLTETKYYVKAITGICFKIDSLIVHVNPAPVANAGGPGSICFGKDIQLHGSGGTSYEWSPTLNLSNASIQDPLVTNATASIDYSLTVKDDNGCFSLTPAIFKLSVVPRVRIYAGRDTSFTIGQPVQLNVIELSNAGVNNYTWSPAYGLNNPNIASPTTILDRDITYFISGKTPENCEGLDTLNIKVFKGSTIYVPNTFTPNGDNINDVLRPLAFGMKEYHYFRVYNRYGQMIFETADFNKGWDGNMQGRAQSTGTFVWIAEAVDYNGNIVQKKGTAILVR